MFGENAFATRKLLWCHIRDVVQPLYIYEPVKCPQEVSYQVVWIM